jgi:ABC-type branched-subunit amino acid transport system ATPase component
VDLTVNRGEVVTLLGRNGAGRTTTLRAIMGLTGARKGSIKVNGTRPSACPRTRSRTSASATARKSAASSRACRARKT